MASIIGRRSGFLKVTPLVGCAYAAAVATARAPGRVNLLGDHTDYNQGFCLPMAIDRECAVSFRPRSDEIVMAGSEELPGTVVLPADGSAASATVEPPWGRFVAGALRAVSARGPREQLGLDLAVSSTVPPGSGLSSSSALSVALTLAISTAWGVSIDHRRAVAQTALDGEVLATGVPGGLMDQLAALFGVAGQALLLDCRNLDVTPVALPPTHAVLVVHCGRVRTLAGTAYAERRSACEETARELGLASLRDATLAQVRDRPLARHVVTENARVLAFADALRANDVNALGPLLLASHESLRDDYEVSTPELDLLVDLLVEHGAVGARLTGAGFGGCVVALVQRNRVDDCAAKVTLEYERKTGLTPAAFPVRPVGGASVTPA
jgi:galactokinase